MTIRSGPKAMVESSKLSLNDLLSRKKKHQEEINRLDMHIKVIKKDIARWRKKYK